MKQVGDLGLSIGYALKEAASALRSAMDDALRPLDLTVSQYSSLEVLGQQPGISAAELARRTFVTRQSMQGVLQGLATRGLLTRPEAAPQGRALPTELTAAGRALLRDASRAVAEVEHRMLEPFSTGDRTRLHGDLLRCAQAVRSGPEPSRPAG
ncbi:MarR family winged helix-turn-helix transcriptional regulator [Modestobacter versicolor]|uniref:MarR family transcriptional regulator n=1 Tax=Modestobacter versicolor TaxID=429133 RepID=A0A323V8F4_9ACTN|nr:MarR family transcriptional regulator [Modestobacter versicolor]MBB3674743.1 DNA-binding MarR family transcriptional regulator [Modestobacter versicolor]PZA21105.1 MarR family transcriptional regulator [Modestobacter versicolor]